MISSTPAPISHSFYLRSIAGQLWNSLCRSSSPKHHILLDIHPSALHTPQCSRNTPRHSFPSCATSRAPSAAGWSRDLVQIRGGPVVRRARISRYICVYSGHSWAHADARATGPEIVLALLLHTCLLGIVGFAPSTPRDRERKSLLPARPLTFVPRTLMGLQSASSHTPRSHRHRSYTTHSVLHTSVLRHRISIICDDSGRKRRAVATALGTPSLPKRVWCAF
jgi:hypothetical protein